MKNSDHLKMCGDNWLASDGSVRVDDDTLDCLVDAIVQQHKYTAVDLRYNRITDAGAEELARLLQNAPQLVELNLMCNELSDRGAALIAGALRGNRTLRSLRMNGNKIGDAGGMHFAQMLQVNEALQELDLGDCDLGIEAFIALVTVMRQNSTVTSLNLNRPLLWTKQEEHVYHIAQMLKVNKTLRELHLQKCDITDWGAQRLSETLADNRTLLVLDLSANRITRDGAKALAQVVKADTGLLVLDLANNRIEDDGAIHLSRSLSAYNRTMKVLNVQHNNIAQDGLCTLAEMMKVNYSVERLFVWGNKLNLASCTVRPEKCHQLPIFRLIDFFRLFSSTSFQINQSLCSCLIELDFRLFFLSAVSLVLLAL